MKDHIDNRLIIKLDHNTLQSADKLYINWDNGLLYFKHVNTRGWKTFDLFLLLVTNSISNNVCLILVQYNYFIIITSNGSISENMALGSFNYIITALVSFPDHRYAEKTSWQNEY